MTFENHTPKISVLTPIYNTKPQHLRECIDSILDQTLTDFEFIILNDSPDNLEIENIVKSYDDIRIKYYKNDSNIGISASRNKLLKLARGEFVAVFDHDDVCLPNRLENEASYLDKNAEVGVVGAFVQYFTEDAKDGTGHIVTCPGYDHEIRCVLTESCYLAHTSVMFRRSVLIENNIKYKAFFSPCEDYQIFNELLDVTCFHVIQEVLVKYRMHNSRTSNLQEEKMRCTAEAVKLDIRNRYPAYRYAYLKNNPRTLFCCKLFGILPFFKFKRNWILLFGVIPLIKIQWKQ